MIPFLRAPSFDAVAAGRKAVLTIKPGIRLHKVTLELGNAAIAANELVNLVGDIAVKLNGKPQRIHTAFELNHMNSLNGAEYAVKSTGTAGQADRKHYLDIWFANPWRLHPAERRAPAWNLVDVPMQIEVNLVAGLAAPTLEATIEADNLPDGAKLGMIQKVYRTDYGAVGSAREIQTFDERDLYECIHFLPVAAVAGNFAHVTSVKLRRNSFDEYDDISFNRNKASLTGWGLNPDAVAPAVTAASQPWYELVLDRTDRLTDGMVAQGVRELRATVNWSSPANGTQTVIVQRTGLPD